jgi:hypothetical protein
MIENKPKSGSKRDQDGLTALTKRHPYDQGVRSSFGSGAEGNSES